MLANRIPFPWLPVEVARGIPSPDYTWADEHEPPRWITVTLSVLADGSRPSDPAPASWLFEVHDGDEDVQQAFRSMAREFCQFAEYTVEDDWIDGDGQRRAGQRTRWASFSGPSSQPVKWVEAEEVWNSVWTEYSTRMLAELDAHRETPRERLRLLREEWAAFRQQQAADFQAEYEHADVWPVTLAVAYIAFGGSWPDMAAYVVNGRRMRSGEALERMFTPLVGAEEDLWRALRRSERHEQRVIAVGRLNGQGLSAEIRPADLSQMRWHHTSQDSGDIFTDLTWSPTNRTTVFSHVAINRESLVRAFPFDSQLLASTGAPARVDDSAAGTELRRVLTLARKWISEQPGDQPMLWAELSRHLTANGHEVGPTKRKPLWAQIQAKLKAEYPDRWNLWGRRAARENNNTPV